MKKVSREQQLIDIIYELVYRYYVKGRKTISFEGVEGCMEEFRGQLKALDFDTQQMGMSWGVLKEEKHD